jgi:hypothetical protein
MEESPIGGYQQEPDISTEVQTDISNYVHDIHFSVATSLAQATISALIWTKAIHLPISTLVCQ